MNNENEFSIDFQALIGRALLQTQRLEFIVHGIVSLFVTLPKHKRFKHLNPKTFLSISKEDRSKRKQTLGQIFEVLKTDIPFIYNDQLDEYLKKRNQFIHEFWRTFFLNGRHEEANAKAFLEEFIQETEIWTKAFKGLFSLFNKAAYSQLSIEQQKISKSQHEVLLRFEQFEIDFIKLFKLEKET